MDFGTTHLLLLLAMFLISNSEICNQIRVPTCGVVSQDYGNPRCLVYDQYFLWVFEESNSLKLGIRVHGTERWGFSFWVGDFEIWEWSESLCLILWVGFLFLTIFSLNFTWLLEPWDVVETKQHLQGSLKRFWTWECGFYLLIIWEWGFFCNPVPLNWPCYWDSFCFRLPLPSSNTSQKQINPNRSIVHVSVSLCFYSVSDLFCLMENLPTLKVKRRGGGVGGLLCWDVVLVSGFILRGDSEEGRVVANRVLGLFMGDRQKRWS